MDFVAKGLARYCQENGLAVVSRIFTDSCIRLLDEFIEQTEYEKSQSGNVAPSSKMFLMVDYGQSAMVQIGPTLNYLSSLHERLPAAFYEVFTHNLWLWMRVYDYRDAEYYSEDQINMLEEEDLKESFYPKVKGARPKCLKKLPSYAGAVRLVKQLLPQFRDSRAAQLLPLCLAMHDAGKDYEPAWPSRLEKEIPEIQDYLEDTDSPGPGVLIVVDEDDLIEACFSEEMQYLGQNYSIGSTLMLAINLDQEAASLDMKVKATFEQLGAMLRSLAPAAELIELIRGMYDEDLRQRRVEPRVQT